MMVLGIDPGALGAIAVIRDGVLVDVIDMPVVETKVGRTTRARVHAPGLHALFAAITSQPLQVWVENVNGGSRDGGGAAFVFGRSVGAIDGVLACHGIAAKFVVPQVWKRRLGLAGAGKGASVERAEELFPEMAGRFRGPRGGAIDGRAEAALIARYGALQAGASDAR